MMVIVSYDVSTTDAKGKARLRKVARICQNYGQRVNNSVFEIEADYRTILDVKQSLLQQINEATDSLRFYYLGNSWKKRVEHFGANEPYDPQGVLIV